MNPTDENRELTDAEKAERARDFAEQFFANVVKPDDHPPEPEQRQDESER